MAMPQQNSYSKEDLVKAGTGELFGEGNSQLPSDNMLMMDRILTITEDGGEFGKGDGSIIKKFVGEYGVQGFNSDAYKMMTEGKIFHTITKGFANMPSHENQLSVEDRWNITQYVQELQKLK